MTTDRQKSFIATLGTDNIPLHFLDLLHGEPAIASSVFASGGFFTGPPQRRDDSHRLGLHPEISADAIPGLLLYFRYTNYGYGRQARISESASVSIHPGLSAHSPLPVPRHSTWSIVTTGLWHWTTSGKTAWRPTSKSVDPASSTAKIYTAQSTHTSPTRDRHPCFADWKFMKEMRLT